YAFLVISASLLFGAFISNYIDVWNHTKYVVGLLMPFIYGLSLAYILNPIVVFVEKVIFPRLLKNKVSHNVRRYLSVFISIIFLFCIIASFFAIIVPQIAKSITSIVSQIPDYISYSEATWNNFMTHYENNQIVLAILQQISASGKEILDSVYTMLSSIVPQIINATIALTSNIIRVGLQAIVGLIISIYVLLAKEKFYAQTKKLLFGLLPDKYSYAIISITHNSNRIFSGFILGKILDSLIIGIICFVGMSLLRLDYAVLISVIVGITNVIPYFGPFIGAIPSVLFLLIVSPVQALIFAIFVLLLQQLDGNIIGPMILGDSTGLSAIWVIFAITLFGGL
ncbi:MAG: AI-2E family transporter, partial [Oscillospiraceae bacterium]